MAKNPASDKAAPEPEKPEKPEETSPALAPEVPPATLLPVVPANRLHGDRSRIWTGPYLRWHENCLEMVCDRMRLEANVRAANLGRVSSSDSHFSLAHDGGEKPIAVCINSISIPAAARGDDILIEIADFDETAVHLNVSPGNKGIGVGVTAFFQSSGQGSA